MKKLAIIGASYLQEPLIEKAKAMGIQTHVFAWECNDVGEKSADYFYPISIIEKDQILNQCRKIGIDGITSIASDLAAVTVNYVADALGLPGNSIEASMNASNKHLMRECFLRNNDPSPKSILVKSAEDLKGIELQYPLIVKPVDRSGSRGITKLYSAEGLNEAIHTAEEQGFMKKALVEEYARGEEYSIECISFHGIHHFLAMTKKYTTGAPHYIETGHLEPALVTEEMLTQVKHTVLHALDSLGITDSASHSELKIDKDGNIRLIEIGGRMGGDLIGSDLVYQSTGIDFVRAVIQVALGEAPCLVPEKQGKPAGVRFIMNRADMDVFEKIKIEHPSFVIYSDIHEIDDHPVVDSATRYGCFLMTADKISDLLPYLPEEYGYEEE